MNYLYLEAVQAEDADVFYLTTESYVAIFLWKLLDVHDEVKLMLMNSNLLEEYEGDGLLKMVPVNLKKIEFTLKSRTDADNETNLPYLLMNNKYFLIGLCSVLRGLCRSKSNSVLAHKLLGFKENCVLAPSEYSPWTRFCEREMISCCERLRGSDKRITTMPDEFKKFEKDLGDPIRVHNIHKYIRELNGDKSIKSIVNTEIEHKFCHGNEINLSDVILYSIFKLLLTGVISEESFHAVPMTRRWMENMETDDINLLENFNEIINVKLFTKMLPTERITLIREYSLDDNQKGQDGDDNPSRIMKPKKKNPHNRNKKQFTKQTHVNVIMEKLKSISFKIESQPGDSDHSRIDDEFVKDLLTQGELPEKRLQNKTSQLKSLAVEVSKLARSGDIIVDFCSGTGHLGLLIAHLLPNCSIIILENKEESIGRAIKRAEKLQLNNVTFYQCNLVSVHFFT